MRSLILILALFAFGCGSKQNARQSVSKLVESYYPKGDRGTIEVIKVRQCEYVLWHHGYGSDMEHYGGCSNPFCNN